MREPLEKIGGGGTKNAFALDKDTVRLAIKLNWSPEQVRSIYLLQKIAHTLLPDNVPDAKALGTDTDGKMYIDVNRVSLDAHHVSLAEEEFQKPRGIPLHNRHELLFYRQKYENGRRDRSALVEKLRSAGFIDAEMPDRNFTHAENRLYYLDFEPAWAGKRLNVNLEAMRSAIHNIEDPEQQRKAETLFSELMDVVPKSLSEKL